MNSSEGCPSMRPRPEGLNSANAKGGVYGVPDVLYQGFQNVRNDLTASHPLEHSEKEWRANQEKMDFAMLRQVQGIHAPLRLQMERNFANKIGRLPCLQSSHVMLDSLTGKDEEIDYEDILNSPADSEVSGQPHMMVEKQMGLL
ncbi:proteasome maturation protein [Lingula anatina]|uniref:Proteasome maturation protein n=1 Tax=Lingula anatina TaxID=7574 RepID=A0A1S3I039_LINAN|nr:proteasome maturation protein [Lingula anatina]|eukprot:XP_013391632.1 proteasome maturation protein [Lingula anatina]